MAVSPDSVERLVSIMKAMGYEVGPGHARGQVDAAFKQAFDPALKALLRIGIDEKASNAPFTPEAKAELLKSIQKTLEDGTKMDALLGYSKGGGYPSWSPVPTTSHAALKERFKANGFNEIMLAKDENIGGVLKFFDNARQYVDDVEAAYNHLATAGVDPPAAEVIKKPDSPARKSDSAPTVTEPKPVKSVVSASSPQETPPPIVKATGSVSLARPDSLTSGATATGYVEKTVVQKDVQWLPPERLPPIAGSFFPAETPSEMLGPVKPEAPLFPLGFKPTSPLDPHPSAPQTTTETQSKPVGPKPSTEQAARFAEEMLIQLGGGINKRIGETKAKSGLGGSLLFEMDEIPAISKADDVFDKNSEKALQGVLKTLQRDLELTDDEVYNYTPAVGQKIIKAYPRLEKKLSEEQKKNLGGEDGVKNFVTALDSLKESGKLTGEKLYEGPPVKLTGLGAWIIQGIFDMIGSKFPKAKGLMDGLLVNLTGYSFSELMPKSEHSAELSKIRKEVDRLPQQEQMKALYLKALEGADGKTSEQLKSVVMSGVDSLMHYSDPEQRKAFTQAVSTAFDEAEKQRTTATPTDAAAAFSQTLKTKWDDLSSPSGPSRVPHQRPGIEIALDPKLQDLAKSLGVKPNSMVDTMDKMIALGVEQNGGKEWPVFFKAGDSLYVMGVTKDKVLTAVPFTPKDILGMNQAINNVPGVDLKSPALELLTGSRYGHIPLKDIRDRLAPERIKTFPEVEAQVGREYKMWQEHVKEEAARPATEARIAGLQTQREEAYKRHGFDIKTFTPISSPGGLAARNAQISDEVLGQYYALAHPVLLKDDYVGRGRVRVLFCDDFNGVRDEKGKPLSSQELYQKKHDSFKTLDVTAEYGRFEAEFQKFRETLPKRVDEQTAYDRYRTHLKDEGINLAEKYPRMASIVFNPDRQRGGQNYAYLMNNDGQPDIIGLFKHLKGETNGHVPATSSSPGFWNSLTRFFTGASQPDEPKDWVVETPKRGPSTSPVYTEEKGGVFEQRAKDRFPEAFKDPPPVEVAKADPASTGLVSSDAPPGSKQRAADLFGDNAKMAEREQEFMSQPTSPAPRVPAGITP